MTRRTWRTRKAVCIGMFWGVVSLIPGIGSHLGLLGHAVAVPTLLAGQRALPCLLVGVALMVLLERLASSVGNRRTARSRRRRGRGVGAC